MGIRRRFVSGYYRGTLASCGRTDATDARLLNRWTDSAIDAPGFHHQWMPDRIQFEPLGIKRATRSALEKMGHVFVEKPGTMGDAEGVMIDLKTGMRLGASDPRS